MFVALHWKTFKPALPNMPAAAVMLVITPYVLVNSHCMNRLRDW